MSFTALRRFVSFASLALAITACCGGKSRVACTYDSNCTGGQVCRGEPTGTASYCAVATGTPTGGTCDDREDCDHGSCLKKVGEDSSPGICSKHCLTPADCPAGFQTCLSISDSGGVKYCLPGNANFAAPPSKKKTTTPAKPPGTPGTNGGPPGGRPPGIKK